MKDMQQNIKKIIQEELGLFFEKKKLPKKYLTKDADAMRKEIGKHADKDDDDASAYGKWDADHKGKGTSGERYKTKKSKATKAYEKMYGDKNESQNIQEKKEAYEKALKNKSEDTGINYSTLKKVYDRGLAAWKTGHRPGTSQHQWAMGRVNSFVTGSGGARKADSDLWTKAKKQKKDKKNEGVDYSEWEKGITLKLNESNARISEDLQYHINNKIPLGNCVFRYGSDKYISTLKEAANLSTEGVIALNENDQFIVDNLSGEKVKLKGVGDVYLDVIYEDSIDEAEYRGKKVKLNKPKRGGSKAYYVYVRDPKTKNIKKVSFGSGGLKAKINDPEARKNFASRHNCDQKKDKTKPGYWSCNLPRYAKSLGLSGGGNYYW